MQIIAGIVTYNPNIGTLTENLNAIYGQVDNVVIVDNGSNNLDEIEVLILSSKYKRKITLIKNVKNLGIAAALNTIMKYSMEKKIKWVLTLDQDSTCPDNIIQEYKNYIKQGKIGIIGPKVYDRNTGYIKTLEKENGEKKIQYVNQVITSASLNNVDIWFEIGGFDEKLFIDLVDFDYCDRLIKANYKILKINSVVLNHEIGNSTLKKTIFGNVVVHHHNEFRKYYMSRNLIYLARKNNSSRKFIKNILSVFKLLVLILLWETNKRMKTISVLKGIRDGFKINVN